MSRVFRRYFISRLVTANQRNKLILKRKCARSATDLFDLPDEHFRQLFRLPKDICSVFIAEVASYMVSKIRTTKTLRIMVALRFFAQGSYQQSVAQDFMLNVSQPTVSRCVKEVCCIMDRHLLAKYVSFPNNEECQRTKQKYYEKFQFPGIVGAIDGTHIKIKGPAEKLNMYMCVEKEDIQ